MAKVILDPMIKGLSGRLGDLVYRISRNGQTYVTLRPDMSKVKWSPAQQDHRRRFKQAIAYAKAAMADPDARAVYEKRAAEENRRPFHMAVSDFFKGKELLSRKKTLPELVIWGSIQEAAAPETAGRNQVAAERAPKAESPASHPLTLTQLPITNYQSPSTNPQSPVSIPVTNPQSPISIPVTNPQPPVSIPYYQSPISTSWSLLSHQYVSSSCNFSPSSTTDTMEP